MARLHISVYLRLKVYCNSETTGAGTYHGWVGLSLGSHPQVAGVLLLDTVAILTKEAIVVADLRQIGRKLFLVFEGGANPHMSMRRYLNSQNPCL